MYYKYNNSKELLPYKQLTIESAVKLKYWNMMAKTRNTIPTTMPNDSGLHNNKNAYKYMSLSIINRIQLHR